MTEEEIKQNAEEYYDKLDSITIEVENEPNSIVDAYIAGAKSMLPEIDHLVGELALEKEHSHFLIEDLRQMIDDYKCKVGKLEIEKGLLSAANKVLEYKLNKYDPEWSSK